MRRTAPIASSIALAGASRPPGSVLRLPGRGDRGGWLLFAASGGVGTLWGGPRQRGPLETSRCPPIGARDEEDRQIEQDDQGQQTQGQIEGEAPPPESAGHRMNQAGRTLRC